MDFSHLQAVRADTTADLTENGVTATLRGPTQARTELGGVSNTYSDGAFYPCNLQEAADPAATSAGAGSRETKFNYVAYLPWDAVLGTAKVLRIGGIDFQIVGSNSREIHRFSLKVELLKVE